MSALTSHPMNPKIVNTGKQIVKAKVLSPSARPLSPCVAVTPGPMCNSPADHHRGSTAVHHHVQLLRSRLEIPACWLCHLRLGSRRDVGLLLIPGLTHELLHAEELVHRTETEDGQEGRRDQAAQHR